MKEQKQFFNMKDLMKRYGRSGKYVMTAMERYGFPKPLRPTSTAKQLWSIEKVIAWEEKMSC